MALFYAAEAVVEGVSEMKLEEMSLDLPAHTITFYLMSYVSFGLAGILIMDQYFGRRMHCFTPQLYKEAPTTIAAHCWEHGYFQRNDTAGYYLPPVKANWLLSSYVYFCIRGFIFLLPHILWTLQFKPGLGACVREVDALLKEVERMWFRFSEKAQDAYRAAKGEQNKDKSDVYVSLGVVKAATRDIVVVSQRLLKYHMGMATFMQIRLAFDMLALPAFTLIDIAFFLTNNFYSASDYYCTLPNDEEIRCIVPVLQFQWHALALSVLCAGFVTLMMLANSIWLIVLFISRNTEKCFLERLPLAKEVCHIAWPKASIRKAYKLMSVFLLQHVSIIQVITFLESFSAHLRADGYLNDSLTQADMRMAPIAAGEAENANEADPIWVSSNRKKPGRRA